MIRLVDVGGDVEDPLDAHRRVALLLIFECGGDEDGSDEGDDHGPDGGDHHTDGADDGDIVDEDTIQFLKNIFLIPLSGDHLHSSAAWAATHHLWHQVVGHEILPSIKREVVKKWLTVRGGRPLGPDQKKMW